MPEATIEDYNLSEQIGHLLRRAYQRHSGIFQKRISGDSITAMQFAVLVAISDGGVLSLTRIGDATAIDPATLRGIIARLSVRNLISSSNDAADRRQRLISLTPQGVNLVEQLLPMAVEISRDTLAPLNAAEAVAIIYLLKRLS